MGGWIRKEEKWRENVRERAAMGEDENEGVCVIFEWSLWLVYGKKWLSMICGLCLSLFI